MSLNEKQQSFFGRIKWTAWFVPLVVFLIGILIRFVDFTDQPLDFNPTRQLRSAIIARGIYYAHLDEVSIEKKEAAVKFASQMSIYEPTIFEHLVAWSYLVLGDEQLWVARLWAILFWVLGGVGLFMFSREIFGLDGAIIALGFFLFLPFGVFASRSFQPDPLMVTGIIYTAWFLHKWNVTNQWKYAILSGLVGGFAVLVKAGAILFVGAMVSSVLISRKKIKQDFFDRKVWILVGLILIQPLLYYLFKVGDTSSKLFLNWTLGLAHLWISPSFYMRWLIRVDNLIGLFAFFLGLIGVIIYSGGAKSVLIGYWIGYGIFGLIFPHQITTHDYYHLALVPLLALSLGSIAQVLFPKAVETGKGMQIALLLVMAVGTFYPLWITRSVLIRQDFREAPKFWEKVGEAIPLDGKTIGLTQDYGHRLMYYGWRKVSNFPNSAQRSLAALRGNNTSDYETYFREKVNGFDYFLITAMNQLDKQSSLRKILNENYPVISEGDGYVIYDLQHRRDD